MIWSSIPANGAPKKKGKKKASSILRQSNTANDLYTNNSWKESYEPGDALPVRSLTNSLDNASMAASIWETAVDLTTGPMSSTRAVLASSSSPTNGGGKRNDHTIQLYPKQIFVDLHHRQNVTIFADQTDSAWLGALNDCIHKVNRA